MTNLAFYPLLPAWCILLVGGVAAAVSVDAIRHGPTPLKPRQRRALAIIRAVTMIVVMLMLLCPGQVIRDIDAARSHLVFLVDRSASMGTADMPDGGTRIDAAMTFLRNLRLPRLRSYPKRYGAFSHQATITADLRELPTGPAAGGTDLRRAFRAVGRDVGLSQTAAVVILTDGLDHSGFAADDVSVPVFSIPVGSDLTHVRDLAIGRIRAPRRAGLREEITVEVPVTVTGIAGTQQTPLTFRVDGRERATRHLHIAAGAATEERFNCRFETEGMHVLHLQVGQLDGEVTRLNNVAEFAVEVVRAADETAAYFPLLTAGFRPLLRELQRGDDRVFTAFYRVGPDRYRLRGQRLNPLFAAGIPARAERMTNVQCFILAAHNGDLIQPAQAQVLATYVQQGGSLILLGGSDSFGPLPAGSPLIALSPVRHLQGNSLRPGRYTISPDAACDEAFCSRLAEIIAANAGDDDLVLRAVNAVANVKAGAEVIAWAKGETTVPLIVWHRYGEGRVVALLTNTLHTWGAATRRDANFGALWQQLLRFTGSQDLQRDRLRVSVNRTELLPGDALVVTARFDQQAGPPAAELMADVTDMATGDEIRSLPMTPAGDTFKAEISGLNAGRFALRVTAAADGEVLRRRYVLLRVGDEMATEHAAVAVDPERFRHYSSPSHIYGFDESERLGNDLLRLVRRNETRRERFLCYETPWPALVLLLLLLAEWILRRRCNLI